MDKSPSTSKSSKKNFDLTSPGGSPIMLNGNTADYSQSVDPRCVFCRSERDDEVKYGELLSSEGIRVHYNCLLTASILAQKLEEDEGVRGFTVGSIRHAARNARKETCVYCEKTGAVIGCCQKKCNRFFHFPCGQNNNCISLFYGTFNSYCHEHANTMRHVKPPENDNCCPVCVEEYTPEDSLFQSECCPTVSHMDCMRQYSYNAGTYVLKCPFCQDDKKFVKCMLEFSCIYIPTREPLFEDHDRMTMELDCCYDDCPEPERCENNDIWSLIKCTLCGSRAMHVCCVKKQPDQMFICPDCGYDESWHEEMRVRLRVGQTSGRAYKFQLSYLTTKFLGIALKDPTNEKITKSGRCSRRYQEKCDMQIRTAAVKLESSKKEKAWSESEDEDEDDEERELKENKDSRITGSGSKGGKRRRTATENLTEQTNKPKRARTSKKGKSSSVISSADTVSAINSDVSTVLTDATNKSDQPPAEIAPVKEKKKRGPPKKKKTDLEAAKKQETPSSGIFDDFDVPDCNIGKLIKPCEIAFKQKDKGLDHFGINYLKPQKCKECNPPAKSFKLGDSPS